MKRLTYFFVVWSLIISAAQASALPPVKYSHSPMGNHPTGRDSRKKRPVKAIRFFDALKPGKIDRHTSIDRPVKPSKPMKVKADKQNKQKEPKQKKIRLPKKTTKGRQLRSKM